MEKAPGLLGSGANHTSGRVREKMTDDEEMPEFLEREDRALNARIEELKTVQYKHFAYKVESFFDEAREMLDSLYQQYLNRDIGFEAAKKQVVLVEYEYEKLKLEIAESDMGEGVLITRIYLFDTLEKEIAFYKEKLRTDIWAGQEEPAEKTGNEGAENTDNNTAAQSAPPAGKIEEIIPEIPDVIQDLVKNSGLVETRRDATGRFKPNQGLKDSAIIGWIVDCSGYQSELTAEVYSKYIYTTNKQKTIEDYIGRARKK
jgi:hypothetical protein